MRSRSHFCYWVCGLVVLNSVSTTFGQSIDLAAPMVPTRSGVIITPADQPLVPAETVMRLPEQAFIRLSRVQADQTTFNELLKALTSQSKLNAIASEEAGKKIVTVNLHDVSVIDALDAVTKANGLFYRVDPQSGIIRIATIEEYERDLASFREEKIRVFTLLYPNPFTVAQAIQQIYGERVQLNTADSDFADLFEIQQRLSRFDLLSQRSSFSTAQGAGAGGFGGGFGGGLGGFGGGLGGFGGGLGGFGAGLGGFGGGLGGFGAGLNGGLGGVPGQGATNQALFDLNQQLSERLQAEEIQRLENALQSGASPTETEEGEELLKRGRATIQISVIRRNNQIVVRTSDDPTMEAIAQLISQLDVPTPLVLLEVKIMNVLLGDGFNSAFDYQFGSRNGTAGQFVSLNGNGQNSNIGPFQPTGAPVAFPGLPQAENIIGTPSQQLGGSGITPGAFAFQIIDSHFRARMQLLETRDRVTSLATPVILTANNEVSRIFVGQTIPVRTGINPAQTVTGNVVGAAQVGPTVNTDLQDVGQSILITPNINADRTVTLRLVVETSEVADENQSVDTFTANGAAGQEAQLDIINRRNASGTIVAQDGMAVVLGGLVSERVEDTRAQVPVLGRLPVVGTLFRRQSTARVRQELVIVVRPYVFNTPAESAATSQEWMCDHSLHPNSPHASGDMNSFNRCEVAKPDPDCNRRANLLRLHNVVPKNY